MGRSSCRVFAVVGLCMALMATTTAFVTPGATITRKQWPTPASQLFMASDKLEKEERAQTATEPSSSTKSKSQPQPQFFFANQESKATLRPETNGETQKAEANGESKTAPEPAAAFDPFQVSSDGNQLESVNLNGAGELKQEQDKQELGIWAARAILLLVAAIWGTNFASVKYLSDLCFHPPCNHPPSEAAFARFGLAALVSFPLLVKQNKDVILAGLECGIFITLGYISQSLALDTISSGKCAFICSLTVVVVPIVSAVIYGKPIKPLNIFAALIALSGVSVLEGIIDFNSLLGIQPAMADAGASAIAAAPVETISAMASSSVETAANVGPLGALASNLGINKGDILALGQPVGFGYTFTRIEYYQEKFEDVPNRVLTIAAAQCVAVGFLSLLWVLYDYGGSLPDFTYMLEPHRLATIGWTGIVTTVFAIFLEGIALQTASATDAAIAFASEPVWASGFGFLLLHEKLGTNSYIGGAIIMMACLVGSASDLPMFAAAAAVDVSAVSGDDFCNEEDSSP